MGRSGGPNAGCKDPAFPVRSGALCYPACRAGFHAVGPVCWQDKPPGAKDLGAMFIPETYDRGAGSVLKCDKNHERHGLLCYDKTPEGWKNIAGILYKNCPPGFTDDGLFCRKQGTYGRGAGYLTEKKCKAKEPQGCEKWGAFWYPKCKPGFKNQACCICAQKCPEGYKDIGVSCAKPSKVSPPRGGVNTCDANEDKVGALCYPKCKPGYDGAITVCHKSCSPGYWNGSSCTRASYPNTAGRPLAGSGFIILLIIVIIAIVGLQVLKRVI